MTRIVAGTKGARQLMSANAPIKRAEIPADIKAWNAAVEAKKKAKK